MLWDIQSSSRKFEVARFRSPQDLDRLLLGSGHMCVHPFSDDSDDDQWFHTASDATRHFGCDSRVVGYLSNSRGIAAPRVATTPGTSSVVLSYA